MPSATHTVCVASADGVPPFTETEHHTSTFFTVRVAGVEPLQPELPLLLPLLVPPLLLLVVPPLLLVLLPPSLPPPPELLHAAHATNAALESKCQVDLFIGVPFLVRCSFVAARILHANAARAAALRPAGPRATAGCSRRPPRT
jgi:hypothetical protein